MRGKDMVALGRIVLAKRERVIALQPWEKGLLGTTLRYAYEVRNAGEYFDEIPDIKIPKEMLQLAEHILESKAGDFDPADVRRSLRGSRGRHAQAQAGRRAGVEAEGRRARLERRQPDGRAQAQHRGGKGLGQAGAGERRPRASRTNCAGSRSSSSRSKAARPSSRRPRPPPLQAPRRSPSASRLSAALQITRRGAVAATSTAASTPAARPRPGRRAWPRRSRHGRARRGRSRCRR